MLALGSSGECCLKKEPWKFGPLMGNLLFLFLIVSMWILESCDQCCERMCIDIVAC